MVTLCHFLNSLMRKETSNERTSKQTQTSKLDNSSGQPNTATCELTIVDDAVKKLLQVKGTIEKERMDLEQEKKLMEGVQKFQKNMVKLNVGGHMFATSRDTLLAYPKSMLATMFSGHFGLEQDDTGAYFIDRDGTHFRYILNYLRGGTLHLPTDENIQQELCEEAQYYQLDDFVSKLKAEIGAVVCTKCNKKFKSKEGCKTHTQQRGCTCYGNAQNCVKCGAHQCNSVCIQCNNCQNCINLGAACVHKLNI